MCGNHGERRTAPRYTQGSPPRVREPLLLTLFLLPETGITPACAGTTDPVNSSDNLIQDHPRVCGNHHRHGKKS